MNLEQFLFQAIYDTELIWVNMLDEKGNITLWNKGAEKISGYSKKEVLGKKDIWDLLYPDKGYRDNIFSKALEIINKDKAVKDFETNITTKDNKKKFILWYSENCKNEHNKSIGSIAIGIDITIEKLLKEKLKTEKEEFETYLNLANIMFVVINNDMTVKFVNKKAEEILGYKREEILGINWFDNFLPEDEKQEVKKVFESIIRDNLDELSYYENHILTKNKEKRLIGWYSTFLKDKNGNVIATLSAGEDVTKMKEQEEHLKQLSFFDSLTGLNNRLFFEEEIKIINTPKNYPISIVVLDADNLKHINDTLGHKAGDELLKNIAQSLRETARTNDIVARIGGDEFVVILPKTNKKGVLAFCNRLRKKCLKTNEISCGLSLGFATQSNPTQSIEILVEKADLMMYLEKKRKKSIEQKGYIHNLIFALDKKNISLNSNEEIIIKKGDLLNSEWQEIVNYITQNKK